MNLTGLALSGVRAGPYMARFLEFLFASSSTSGLDDEAEVNDGF